MIQNVTIYNISSKIDIFSSTLFIILIFVQVVLLILAVLLNFKILVQYFGRKKHRAVSHVSDFAGALAFLRIFFDGTQKALVLIINIVCYICFFWIIYDVGKFLCKWYLVRKFEIKDYNQED